MGQISTKKCLICKRSNDTLHWHESEDGGLPWVWCQGVCQRAYSMYEYTAQAGLTLGEFLANKFEIKEAPPNEVQKMEWPKSFIPLFHRDAKPGVEYLKKRGIDPDDGMYYDTFRKGIVFPYFFDQAFVGAQIRFLEMWTDYDGSERKIDTVPGTRLGLLFYGWNQAYIRPNVKGIIVTEGAFNSLALSQSIGKHYPGLSNNPWMFIATSGSGLSQHHIETLKNKKEEGYKVVLAFDSDAAGMKGFEKAAKNNAITHFAFTENSEQDWNDKLKESGHEELTRYFLSSIRKI